MRAQNALLAALFASGAFATASAPLALADGQASAESAAYVQLSPVQSPNETGAEHGEQAVDAEAAEPFAQTNDEAARQAVRFAALALCSIAAAASACRICNESVK